MALALPAAFFAGGRGARARLLAALPVFAAMFGVVCLLWLPYVLLAGASRVVRGLSRHRCRRRFLGGGCLPTCFGRCRPSLARDVYCPLMIVLTIVWSAVLKHNPLCPLAVEAYVGRWFFAILSVWYDCAGALRGRAPPRRTAPSGAATPTQHSPTKMPPASAASPATASTASALHSPTKMSPAGSVDISPVCSLQSVDLDRVVVHMERLGDGVYAISGSFRAGPESVCSCVIVQHAQYLLIYNPIFCKPEVYRNFRLPSAERVVVVLGNWAHHMAADVAIEAFAPGDVVVVGSRCAARRHEPQLEVQDIRDLGLPGIQALHLEELMYDEWWLHFEPAGILLVCDMFPHTGEYFDRLPFGNAALCFDRHGCCFLSDSPMPTFQRVAISDHQAVADKVREALDWGWSSAAGAHPSGGRDLVPRGEVEEYWAWLLAAMPARPRRGADQEYTIAEIGGSASRPWRKFYVKASAALLEPMLV